MKVSRSCGRFFLLPKIRPKILSTSWTYLVLCCFFYHTTLTPHFHFTLHFAYTHHIKQTPSKHFPNKMWIQHTVVYESINNLTWGIICMSWMELIRFFFVLSSISKGPKKTLVQYFNNNNYKIYLFGSACMGVWWKYWLFRIFFNAK